MRGRARLRQRRKPDPARNARAAHRNAREPDEYHRALAPAASNSTPAPEQYAASRDRDGHAGSADEYRDNNVNAIANEHADCITNELTDTDAHRDNFTDATGTNANGKPNARDGDAVGECCT